MINRSIRSICRKWIMVEPYLLSMLKLVNVQKRCEGNEVERECGFTINL